MISEKKVYVEERFLYAYSEVISENAVQHKTDYKNILLTRFQKKSLQNFLRVAFINKYREQNHKYELNIFSDNLLA